MSTAFNIEIPRIAVGDKFEELFDWLTLHLAGFFDSISSAVDSAVERLVELLESPDPVVLVVVFALLGLAMAGWKFGLASVVGLLLIVSMDQWPAAMQTLAMVLVAAFVSILIAIPIGILAAQSRWVSAIVRPVMDLMQTMPAFVWLVPVVTLFGIGVVPGVIATIIFALPPGVRLTELGIRQVDAEIVEASHAFGATPRQTLFGVQLPLALPTIMAGVNQVIMMSLSMAVIAGLVGGGGLGGQVTSAIATLNIGLGFEAGLSVVALAIYMDRLTASFAQVNQTSVLSLWQRRRRPAAEEEAMAVEETSEEPQEVHNLETRKIGA